MPGRDRTSSRGTGEERSALLASGERQSGVQAAAPVPSTVDRDGDLSSSFRASRSPSQMAVALAIAACAVVVVVLVVTAAAPYAGGDLSGLGLGPLRDRPVCERDANVSPLCLPSFMLIGVQKSATSSFYQLFKQHPEVSVPNQKVGERAARRPSSALASA